MAHPLRWLSLVALETPAMPAFADVAGWHARRYPNAAPLVAAGSTPNLLSFTIGEYTAAATLVPRPIPWSHLEGPAETAWYWPNAADALRGHAAHILVTLVDEGGRSIAKAASLTHLTAAVAATTPSVGVFWGPGRLVHPSAAFIEHSGDAGENNLPLFLWVDFRVERTGETSADNVWRLFTTGLAALDADEIEVPRFVGDPQTLVNYAYNTAHYLLDRRKVVRDGDTIGLTDDVQATARRAPSMLGGGLEVIELSFDGHGDDNDVGAPLKNAD